MPKIVNHQARRWEISEVAAKLIAGGGLEAATFREIAEASNYSKGVVEHYFDGKDELISGALDWANKCYEQRVGKATAGLIGLRALRRRIEATLPLNKIVRDEWKVRLVFWSMAAIQEDLRERQEVRFRRSIEHFETDIAAAMREGDIDSQDEPRDLARRLVNMISGLSVAALHNHSLYTRQFLLGEIDHLLYQLARHYTPVPALRRATHE
jgi:AcrR family transcriptional regulator